MEDLSAAKLYRECKGGSEILEKLPLERGAHVLDLGCGTGELAAVMAERVGPGGRVTAVDPDSARIKVAMETYGGKSNLEFAVASDADFPEGEYDIVCANLVMHWIKDKNAAFKRIFKNLKPGGHFAFVAPDDSPRPEIQQSPTDLRQLRFLFLCSLTMSQLLTVSSIIDGVRKKYQGQEIHCSYPVVNAVLTKPL